MNNLFKFTVLILLTISVQAVGNENFFSEAKNLFDKGKIEESKFLFQRNIVFNPKDSKSYLYLAKIYETEENDVEKEKNINTTLLLEPDNEEAMYMLIDIELEKSNFSKVKSLTNDFKVICSELCGKVSSIKERLKNFEAS